MDFCSLDFLDLFLYILELLYIAQYFLPASNFYIFLLLFFTILAPSYFCPFCLLVSVFFFISF